MLDLENCCKVTEFGIAHLFLAVDFGSVCVCGRKILTMDADEQGSGFHDVAQEPREKLVGILTRGGRLSPRCSPVDLILARGRVVIEAARRACASRSLARARRAVQRSSELERRGERTKAAARDARQRASDLRSRRGKLLSRSQATSGSPSGPSEALPGRPREAVMLPLDGARPS